MDAELKHLLVPALGRGWNPFAPPRAMNERSRVGLWRNFSNFRIDYGSLWRRPAVRRMLFNELGHEIPDEVHGNQSDGTTTVGYCGQMGMWIQSFPDAFVVIVVTDRDIWQWEQGRATWVNLTPIYDVGNVTISSGTTVTGGGGTEWLDRKISATQLIQLDGDWYVIEEVVSNNEITLKDSYTGSPLSNDPYVIRRTFYGHDRLAIDWPIFAHVVNGDLFVAGATVGGSDDAVAPPDRIPAVIKVADALTDAVTASDSEYIVARYKIETSTKPDTLLGWTRVHGFQPLEDGRLVLLTRETSGAGSTFYFRLRFSSHTDLLEWGQSPGGFYDITALEGEGSALGRMGRDLVIHSPYGVALAHMTGEDSLPLWIDPQPLCDVGCASPRTVKTTRRGQVFLGADFQVYSFDGSRLNPIGDPVKEWLGENASQQTGGRITTAHAALDTYRGQYSLYIPQNWKEDDTDRVTYRFTLDFNSGEWTKQVIPGILSVASDVMRFNFGVPAGWTDRRDGHSVVSFTSYDPDVAKTNPGVQASEDMLMRLDEDDAEDFGFGWTEDGSQGFFYAESDDFDFGMPGLHKTIDHVTVWFFGRTAGSDTVEVSLSSDQGQSKALSESRAITFTPGEEQIEHFYFDSDSEHHEPSETWRVRIEIQSETTCRCRIERYRIAYYPRHPDEHDD